MKMSSFSIRDILNLPEDTIRSLNAKGEDQMSTQERRSVTVGMPGPDSQDEEETSSQDIPESSTNHFYLAFKATQVTHEIVSSSVLKISKLKSFLL